MPGCHESTRGAKAPSIPLPRLRLWFVDPVHYLPRGLGICVDLGCGSGRHRGAIQRRGYDWVGVDVELRGAHEGARLAICDGAALPFADGSAQVVFSCQVLEHVPRPVELLCECNRILDGGGVVLGSSAFVEPGHDRVTYFHAGESGIRQMLEEAGFEDIEITAGLHGSTNVVAALYGQAVARLLSLPIGLCWWIRLPIGFLSRRLLGAAERDSWEEYVTRKTMEAAGQLLWRATKP